MTAVPRAAFGLLVIGLALAAGPAAADWVKFQTSGGATVSAVLALPEGAGPHPAVIYNHGTVVRRDGYQTAADKGYDLDGYAAALAKAGYVGLAPVREHLAGADYAEAVSGGVETVRSAVAYLKSRGDVDGARIGAMGFSEGGLVTLWSAIKGIDVKAIVLMSPATIRDAGDWQLKSAAKRGTLGRLTMPVMLSVGENDNRSIRKVTARRLIPNLKSLGIPFEHKTDYPGDHKWFWSVQANHFADVAKFLDRHLKN